MMFELVLFAIIVLFVLKLASIQRRQPDHDRSKSSYQSAYRSKAQTDVIVRAGINELPRAYVKHVCDGDTVIFGRGWSQTFVRLDSIDCPEGDQDWGDIAKYGAMKLINRHSVRFEEHGLDIYGRILATIYVRQKGEWINVNERMVMLGHAWVMRSFYDHLPRDRREKLDDLERWARSKRVGLWATDNPVPPWEWRNPPAVKAAAISSLHTSSGAIMSLYPGLGSDDAER